MESERDQSASRRRRLQIESLESLSRRLASGGGGAVLCHAVRCALQSVRPGAEREGGGSCVCRPGSRERTGERGREGGGSGGELGLPGAPSGGRPVCSDFLAGSVGAALPGERAPGPARARTGPRSGQTPSAAYRRSPSVTNAHKKLPSSHARPQTLLAGY